MGDRYIVECPLCPKELSPPPDWPEDQPWYPDTQLYFAEFTNWKSRCGKCGREFEWKMFPALVTEAPDAR